MIDVESMPKEKRRPTKPTVKSKSTHNLDGSQDHAATPSHVSATKKYIWMPSESESEPQFKGGRKLWKKHPNWTEEEKEAMYRIFIWP